MSPHYEDGLITIQFYNRNPHSWKYVFILEQGHGSNQGRGLTLVQMVWLVLDTRGVCLHKRRLIRFGKIYGLAPNVDFILNQIKTAIPGRQTPQMPRPEKAPSQNHE